jgi:hypothetical protein
MLSGVAIALAISAPANAATLSAKDVQIIAKAIGFLDPSPPGGIVAVVYNSSNPASKADADDIVASFGSGLRSGSGTVTAKAIDNIGDGQGYVAIILAEGVAGDAPMAASKAQHIPCITGNTSLVEAGTCVMSFRSDPKVDITVNHAAAQAVGLKFASAFRMLIHEI